MLKCPNFSLDTIRKYSAHIAVTAVSVRVLQVLPE